MAVSRHVPVAVAAVVKHGTMVSLEPRAMNTLYWEDCIKMIYGISAMKQLSASFSKSLL
jgi:hypothetical protein